MKIYYEIVRDGQMLRTELPSDALVHFDDGTEVASVRLDEAGVFISHDFQKSEK